MNMMESHGSLLLLLLSPFSSLQQVYLAHQFESLMKADDRFELVFPVTLGLVCFRLKGSDELNERLLKEINGARRIHLTPSKIYGRYILRFAVCSRWTEYKDVQYAWNQITATAARILISPNPTTHSPSPASRQPSVQRSSSQSIEHP